MEVSTKELRIQPGRIIEQAVNGEEVTVTFRGKALVRIVPVSTKASSIEEEAHSIFGMWKNHDLGKTVNAEVRSMREGREF
jgi:prevent-host-death family protein